MKNLEFFTNKFCLPLICSLKKSLCISLKLDTFLIIPYGGSHFNIICKLRNLTLKSHVQMCLRNSSSPNSENPVGYHSSPFPMLIYCCHSKVHIYLLF